MNRVLALDTCAIINLQHINSFSLIEFLKYYPFVTEFINLEFEKGYEASYKYFLSLIDNRKIQQVPLELDDLIAMAAVPKSRRISDAELSCFIISQRLGAMTMTDDVKAINYARLHIGLNLSDVLRLIDLLFEAYDANLIGDNDLRTIQDTLKEKKFIFKNNLLYEAAKRKLKGSSN